MAQTGNKVASEEGDLGICLRKRRSAEKLVFDEAWFFFKQGRLDMLPRLLHWLDLRAPVAEALHLGTGFAALAALAIAFTNLPTTQGQLDLEAGNTLRMTSELVAPTQFEDRPVSVASLNFVANEYTTPQALRVSNFGEAAYEMAKERRCLATGIYFEARSESHFGQMAVAKVILNRVASRDYPNTICGVVYQGAQRRTGCQFSFTCDGISDRPKNKLSWRKSMRLADFMTKGHIGAPELVGDRVYHYHADYVDPYWANRGPLQRVVQIGKHIFYARGGRQS